MIFHDFMVTQIPPPRQADEQKNKDKTIVCCFALSILINKISFIF